MPLQSRNTPSKDALPLAAADPPSTPRGWLTTRFKEEVLATNTKPLILKKEHAAKTSMLNREALKRLSSASMAFCAPGVSG